MLTKIQILLIMGDMDSDKHLTKHVRVSYHTMYRSPRSRNAAVAAACLIEQALPHFRQLLQFPDDIKIRIAGIKGCIRGRYIWRSSLAVLDNQLIYKPRELMRVLAHELVHAEQYHQGRLANVLGEYRWHGEPNKNKGSTYAAYRKRPWEIEAFSRQDELGDHVAAALNLE